jgi:hypothetical protein
LAASRTRFLIPHFILLPLFDFPPSGAVDKIVLPVGMQSVDFLFCSGITGTTDFEMSDVHIFNTFWRPAAVHPSFLIVFFPSSLLPLLYVCSFSQVTLRSGIFPWA